MKRKTKILKKPVLYRGNIAIDERGIVGFNNDLDLSKVKRFYFVQNHKSPFIRAWHGHFKEDKYFIVVQGVAQIVVMPIRKYQKSFAFNTAHPHFEIHKTVLSSAQPSVYYVPAGYANGVQTLADDTKVMVLSNLSYEKALNDDYRMNLDKRDKHLFEVVEK